MYHSCIDNAGALVFVCCIGGEIEQEVARGIDLFLAFGIISNYFYLGELNWKEEERNRWSKEEGRRIEEEEGGTNEGYVV